jgi:hypothetical protein
MEYCDLCGDEPRLYHSSGELAAEIARRLDLGLPLPRAVHLGSRYRAYHQLTGAALPAGVMLCPRPELSDDEVPPLLAAREAVVRAAVIWAQQFVPSARNMRVPAPMDHPLLDAVERLLALTA